LYTGNPLFNKPYSGKQSKKISLEKKRLSKRKFLSLTGMMPQIKCLRYFFCFTNIIFFVNITIWQKKFCQEPRGSGLSEALCLTIPEVVSVSDAFFWYLNPRIGGEIVAYVQGQS